MKKKSGGSSLLVHVLPEFAAELERLLAAAERPDLAAQVQTLRVTHGDRCGDDFCQSFYTDAPRAAIGRAREQYESVALDPDDGMVILDVVGGRIRFVEVLYREDVKAGLRGAGIR
jgi:hypothetical protein